MNCLIIEDETMARTALRKMCSQCGEFNLIDEAVNATQASQKLLTNNYDVAFLDVVLPEFSGFQLAKNNSKTLPPLIVTTSEREFALDAFEHDALDFLLKPFEYSRFLKAISKVNQPSLSNYPEKQEKKQLFIKVDSKFVNLNVDDIMYVEAYGDYVNVRTDAARYIVHSTLKGMLEKLPDSVFMKVHRSFIVNMSSINNVQNNSIVMGNKVIPISRSNRPKVMQRLNAV